MMFKTKVFRNNDELEVVVCSASMQAYFLETGEYDNIEELYKDGWSFHKETTRGTRFYYEGDNVLIVEFENGRKLKEFWEYGKPKFKELKEARA